MFYLRDSFFVPTSADMLEVLVIHLVAIRSKTKGLCGS
jgi:hypothetical protein